jgi:molybdenum cofactor cytidylyltransferase
MGRGAGGGKGGDQGEHAATSHVRAQGGRITLTSYRGRQGHPIVFARELFEQLRQLSGDKAAWKILDAHPDWVRKAAVDHAFPDDVDTRQDYEALLRQATPLV